MNMQTMPRERQTDFRGSVSNTAPVHGGSCVLFDSSGCYVGVCQGTDRESYRQMTATECAKRYATQN